MKATLSSRSRLKRDNPPQPKRHAVGVAGTLVALLLLAAGLAVPITDWASTTAVYAQSGGGFDLTWNTLDNGGLSFSSGGGYTLGGTAGQADAATWSGGGYTLVGGFWHAASAGAAPGGGKVYLPIIVKDHN
jgi:hypothetical protein